MKFLAVVVLFFAVTTPVCLADAITDIATVPTESQISTFITVESVLLLAPGVADDLAGNLLAAQQEYTYTAFEPDSLSLSVAAVLRAISLESSDMGATEIVNEALTPLPFWQSILAIDDRVSVSFSVNGVTLGPGDVINFGSVQVGDSSTAFSVVTTPEPATFALLLAGLAVVAFGLRKPCLTK